MLSFSVLSNFIAEILLVLFLLTDPFLSFITPFFIFGFNNSFLPSDLHLFFKFALKLPEPFPINSILTTLGEWIK